MSNQGALAALENPDTLNACIAELASGTLSKSIAARFGCSASAVRDYLRRKAPEAYQQAISEQAHSFVEDSLQEHENLPEDALAIARARARGDFRLKYARAHNEAYRDKQQIEHTGRVQVDHTLRTDIGALIDAAVVADTPNSPIDGESARIPDGCPTNESASD